MKNTGPMVKIRAGFIPLIDCAILIAALEVGFARKENISLSLHRETSWANIRDKLSLGHFDVAHMLAPMPIAANLRLDPLHVDLIAPMALGLNGNTFTISNDLWSKALRQCDKLPTGPADAALALARVIHAANAATGSEGRRICFAVVHPMSSHYYELAYFFAFAGIRLGIDVDLIVLPPQLMTDALATGQISGFCAGEPWGSLAVARGHGKIATTKAAIWCSSPEKVLGMRQTWADDHPSVVSAFIRAMYRAAQWCDQTQNHHQLAAMLSRPEYLDQPTDLIQASLAGLGGELQGANAFIFESKAATFPWISHALWFYSQMVRWGQAELSLDAMEIVRRTYRPDIYRAALSSVNATIPSASSKREGALNESVLVSADSGALRMGPDVFFDGRVFDPDDLPGYLRLLEQSALKP